MSAAKKSVGKKTPLCTACKKRPQVQRKVCPACLASAYRMIRSGKITEQQAIDAGLLGERSRHASEWMKLARQRLPDAFKK
jgi:hypothetical protein